MDRMNDDRIMTNKLAIEFVKIGKENHVNTTEVYGCGGEEAEDET